MTADRTRTEAAALPHLGAAGVAVRELEWAPEPPYHVARVLNGHYAIEKWNGQDRFDLIGTFISLRGAFRTFEAAKAAAQADFDQRIRSALVPSPVPQEATAEPVAWRGPFTAADAALDELRRAVASTMGYDPETWPTHRNAPLAIAALVALLKGEAGSPPSHDAELLAALRDLRQAVCGETGFASAVREHSGLAYPWPALDIAEAKADAVLSRAAPAQEGGRSDGE